MPPSHRTPSNPALLASRKVRRAGRCCPTLLEDASKTDNPGYAEELDRAAAASIFAQNPHLVSLIQGRLGGLIGRSSGYIESLPTEVKRRVAGLKGIQKDHSKLEAEFQEEVLQLEKKYFAKFTPLYQKRSEIINGSTEPTEEEVAAGEEDDEPETDNEDEDAAPKEEKSAEPAAKVSGIPEFWLSAMKNQVSLAEMITDRDEEALKSLTDIRMEYLDKPGFRLIFEFAENAYFTNKIVTKTYFYQNESGYGGDFIYDHAEGDKIDWKPSQDLTVRVEQKKQRNKSKSVSLVSLSLCVNWSLTKIFDRHKANSDRQEDRPHRVFLQLFLAPQGADRGRR